MTRGWVGAWQGTYDRMYELAKGIISYPHWFWKFKTHEATSRGTRGRPLIFFDTECNCDDGDDDAVDDHDYDAKDGDDHDREDDVDDDFDYCDCDMKHDYHGVDDDHDDDKDSGDEYTNDVMMVMMVLCE